MTFYKGFAFVFLILYYYFLILCQFVQLVGHDQIVIRICFFYLMYRKLRSAAWLFNHGKHRWEIWPWIFGFCELGFWRAERCLVSCSYICFSEFFGHAHPTESKEVQVGITWSLSAQVKQERVQFLLRWALCQIKAFVLWTRESHQQENWVSMEQSHRGWETGMMNWWQFFSC